LGATPPNLTIRGDAQVDRVVFAGTEAVGVRLAGGTVVEAGHVALCAGGQRARSPTCRESAPTSSTAPPYTSTSAIKAPVALRLLCTRSPPSTARGDRAPRRPT